MEGVGKICRGCILANENSCELEELIKYSSSIEVSEKFKKGEDNSKLVAREFFKINKELIKSDRYNLYADMEGIKDNEQVIRKLVDIASLIKTNSYIKAMKCIKYKD